MDSYKIELEKYNIDRITSLDEIKIIRNEWKKLVENIQETNIYIDPDYFIQQFESRAKGAKPHVMLFKKDGKSKAILIGWTKEQKIPCWLGYYKIETPLLNSLEIEIGGLVTDGTKEAEEVLKKYLKSVLLNKNFELILIDHISETNPLWESLISGAALGAKPVYKESTAWVSKIYDKETDSPNELHSSKTKAKFRRKARRLLEQFNNQLKIIKLTSQDDMEFFIKNADIIGQKSYQYAIDVGVKNNSYWRNMLNSLVEGNFFRGYLLMNNDKPIAYSQGAIYKDYYYQFATAYDLEYRKFSPGEYLRLEFTKDLIEEKIGFIDYGYGDADYKRMFGTHSVKEATLRIYGKGLKPKIAKGLDKGTTTISEKLKNKLEKAGLFNKIKKMWRSKLSK